MLNAKFKALAMMAAAIVGTLALAGCGTGGQNDDTLVVALRAEPSSLDPQAARDIPSSSVMTQIFSTLVRLDEDMAIKPYLATSWERLDDYTYEFNLREDVSFHNGELLTAQDAAFSIIRATQSPATSPIMGPIDPDGVIAIDDHTLRITTLQPFSPLLFHLTQNAAAIVPKAAVEAAGDQFGQHPIGTGPFVFESWDAGDQVELSRNDGYFMETAHFKNLTMRFITEANTRFISLETGEVQIAVDLPPTVLNRVAEDPDLTLVREPDLRINYLGMNVNQPPFDQLGVRQAVNYAIDTQLLIDTVLEGVGGFTDSPLAPAIFGADTSLSGYGYDPDRARELLALAGFNGGFDTTFYIDSDPLRISLATAIANQLGQVGINVELVTLEWATFLEQTSQGNHGLFILGWTNSTGDADATAFALFHSSSHGALGNRTFFNNPRADELIILGRETADEGGRLEIYRELQQIVIDEAIWVPLFTGENLVGIQNNFQGFRANPTNLHRYNEVFSE
ncbi:MAG: ABC transporter substrate-binding protein [Turicibacter sp.]|nr:ABC transporter substrate-binding protein [Turicibacter sp.]